VAAIWAKCRAEILVVVRVVSRRKGEAPERRERENVCVDSSSSSVAEGSILAGRLAGWRRDFLFLQFENLTETKY
jgi:hypothetical protein